jgi:hypothetical protein
MKIVKIQGGLGNQMFQFAFSKALENAIGEKVYLDISSYSIENCHNGFEINSVFNLTVEEAPMTMVRKMATLPENIIKRIRRKYLTKKSHFIDKKFCYQPEVLKLRGDRYFEGYWQSEKYILPIERTVRKLFEFRKPLNPKNEELLSSSKAPIVGIHVRRGDYIKDHCLNICTPNYYHKALGEIKRNCDIGIIFIFSDDIKYCKSNIDTGGIETVYIDWNRKENSWQDMAMMVRCDVHIISNSSFSWWGAWLNRKTEKVVIAPFPWNSREIVSDDTYYHHDFKDIIPHNWLRIPA